MTMAPFAGRSTPDGDQPAALPGLRVLHLLKTSHGARWALAQVEQLVALGVEVHVALPPGGPLFDAYARAGAAVHPVQLDLPVGRPWAVPAALSHCRALVRQVRPDLIHSHFVGTTVTARLGLGGRHSVPRLFQVPGPLHLEHAVFRAAEIGTAGAADYWIGSCRWTVERYRRSGVPAHRLFLSYYGIGVDRFVRPASGTLRRELGLGADEPLVGMLALVYAPKRYLGERRGLKGHEDLADAVALCRRAEPRLRCVFVGGPWQGAAAYERRMRAYVRARCGDAAVFLGTVADVPTVLADVDVLAIPSRSENVGAAAEGLLLGLPIVATRVGGLPDLIEDPATGWLVPPRDPERLAAAILDALRHPEQGAARAKRGRSRARELFDVRRTAKEVLAIYGAVLGSRSARSAA